MAGVFTIPPHRAFADTLAAGLLDRTTGDPLALARGLILLPNNRAVRAVTDAFVRRADGGLLLPRLVPIGDPDLGDRIGALFEPADAEPLPPAIDPVARRMILARLVSAARAQAGDPVDGGEAMRLAADLARVIDQLDVEEVPHAALRDAVPAELSRHWETSLGILATVLEQWAAERAALGVLEPADRRNRLLRRIDHHWRTAPPAGPVIAAGIAVASPAVARLLRRVARMAQGQLVLPGLDLAMPQAEWDALGPDDAGQGIETHPQFGLKRLLEAIGTGRDLVQPWRGAGGPRSPALRGRAVANALAPAAFTARWQEAPPAERRLSGVRAAEFATPAEEAQAIALALREAVETPGRTAALVTPDRALAQRVSAHLARWRIAADDTAGRALSATPPGTLLLSIAEAAAERFAPVALVTLLKHPLVRAGDARLAWLDGVRKLDRALRGPRPAPGLAGVEAHLEGKLAFWGEARALLDPLEARWASAAPLADLLAAVREAATRLAGDTAWSRPAGRAAAETLAALEAAAPLWPDPLRADALPAILKQMLDGVAVRPPQGGHPRVAISGLIEARLQQADLMILSGLNEGVWPALPAPDPWLAPALRRALGLPGLERRIGVQAHDLAQALGAPRVLLTRARRDARAPTVASRFWLRMDAMTGGVTRAPLLARWAEALDRPTTYAPAARPAPSPPVADRPNRIAVTRLDRLKADPYAFYASQMLRLSAWDGIDADPSAAWRGTAVHRIFQLWMEEDRCDPLRLRPRGEAMLADMARHPVLRALWTPRLLEAIGWAAETMLGMGQAGRVPLVAERKGEATVAGVTLYGTVDRIDRLPEGGLAIVDYKTGQPPATRAVAAGYAMQLGLLGLIAEHGGFAPDVQGVAQAFEYWSLAAHPRERTLGHIATPVGVKKDGSGIPPEEFTKQAARVLAGAVAEYLAGDAPFVAKLHPEHAPYADYDQLMRLDEWYGRTT